jgi:hypothetical protein
MTDAQFAHRVAKLNSNVLYLCYTQNVNPELLHPARTLHNILLLLNTEVSDLGRYFVYKANKSGKRYYSGIHIFYKCVQYEFIFLYSIDVHLLKIQFSFISFTLHILY